MPEENRKADPSDARAVLRGAWEDMIAALQEARQAIDHPQLHPPPPSERNLAEGYRYLLGYIFGAIERAQQNPRLPYFRRAIQPTDKATIDNADALYLCTPIDGRLRYLIRGRARDWHHWRGVTTAAAGRKAPQYVIIEATTAYAGDSGKLDELSPAVRTNTGVLDSANLQVEPDGSFEILVAPERPPGYARNYLPTRRRGFTACHLVVRELFHDWAREDPLDLQITCLDAAGGQPGPPTVPEIAELLRTVGRIVNHQMRFWNQFYALVLETYADVNGDGKRFMPRNDINAPTFASVETGGGQSTNVYAGGVYELRGNEALIVEVRVPAPPAYTGFHLANLWGESLDYANHTSSLNGGQVEPDADGAVRYVVAHRDPGVPNWLDTTGLPEGFMALRWTYPRRPPQLPAVRVKKVDFHEIRRHLPAETRTVTAAERREQIRIRQEHVQRRYRQY